MKTKLPFLAAALVASSLPAIATELEAHTYTPPNGQPITYFRPAEPQQTTIAIYQREHKVVVLRAAASEPRRVSTRTTQFGNSTQIELPQPR
ncbi:MAG TPA: hypothetical protein VEO95_13450 [Chthoniobacteraceae bacterium]|nr:hypothetical protein [Chthoniobacteraceae bacterium]